MIGVLGMFGLGASLDCSQQNAMQAQDQHNAFMAQQNVDTNYNALLYGSARNYQPPVRTPKEWETGWWLSQAEWELIP